MPLMVGFMGSWCQTYTLHTYLASVTIDGIVILFAGAMVRKGLASLIMIVYVMGVSSQAPGDETLVCVTGTAAQTYPDNWNVLMDSRSYRFLLNNDAAVWDEIDLDSNNDDTSPSPTNVSTIETSL